MKVLIAMICLVVLGNVNANVLNNFEAASGGKVTKTYTVKGLKKDLGSNKVICLSFNRKAYLSKGYINKFGNDKQFCNAKDAKTYGFVRLDKKNLPLSIRLKK